MSYPDLRVIFRGEPVKPAPSLRVLFTGGDGTTLGEQIKQANQSTGGFWENPAVRGFIWDRHAGVRSNLMGHGANLGMAFVPGIGWKALAGRGAYTGASRYGYERCPEHCSIWCCGCTLCSNKCGGNAHIAGGCMEQLEANFRGCMEHIEANASRNGKIARGYRNGFLRCSRTAHLLLCNRTE